MENQNERNQDEIFDAVRAKVIWGEDRDSVFEFLSERGVSKEASAEYYQLAREERSADIRIEGWRKAIIGAVILFLGILLFCSARYGWVPEYHVPGGRIPSLYRVLITLGIGSFLIGGWRAVDGTYNALRADKL